MDPEAITLVSSLLPEIEQWGTHVAVAPHQDGVLVLEWSRDGAEFTVEMRRGGNMILTTDDEKHDLYDEVEVRSDADALRAFMWGSRA